jgi:hypothetical protein
VLPAGFATWFRYRFRGGSRLVRLPIRTGAKTIVIAPAGRRWLAHRRRSCLSGLLRALVLKGRSKIGDCSRSSLAPFPWIMLVTGRQEQWQAAVRRLALPGICRSRGGSRTGRRERPRDAATQARPDPAAQRAGNTRGSRAPRPPPGSCTPTPRGPVAQTRTHYWPRYPPIAGFRRTAPHHGPRTVIHAVLKHAHSPVVTVPMARQPPTEEGWALTGRSCLVGAKVLS